MKETRSSKLSSGVLALAGLMMSMPSLAADQGSSGGSGGTQQGQHTFQQQRSDKTQQGQQMINEQPMKEQDSSNTGGDLSGGRDRHLGPQATQDLPPQKRPPTPQGEAGKGSSGQGSERGGSMGSGR